MIFQFSVGPVVGLSFRTILIPAAIILMLSGLFTQPDPQPLYVPDQASLARDLS